MDINTRWPFSQHLLETRLKEEGNLALPLLEIPGYKWWNCENCLGNIGASAERLIEKENVRDSDASMLPYNVTFDCGCLMLLTSMQENQNENVLDHAEIVEGLTVENSGYAAASRITNSEEKISGISHCLSNYRNSEGTIHNTETCYHAQGRKVVCVEMGQPVMEKLMSFISVSETKELNSKKENVKKFRFFVRIVILGSIFLGTRMFSMR